MNSHVEQFRQFSIYNNRFNEKIYETANRLSDQERKENRGAFFGSIHGTLNHLLLADRIWLGRFRKTEIGSQVLMNENLIEQFDSLKQELYSDFSILWNERKITDQLILNWAEQLTQPDLEKIMKYNTSNGLAREHAAWIAIAHFFNHQTHHRGQVTTLLFQLGQDPGVTDFLFYAEMKN